MLNTVPPYVLVFDLDALIESQVAAARNTMRRTSYAQNAFACVEYAVLTFLAVVLVQKAGILGTLPRGTGPVLTFAIVLAFIALNYQVVSRLTRRDLIAARTSTTARMTVDGSGIKLESDGISDHIRWIAVRSVRGIRAGILLTTTSGNLIVPKRVYSAVGEEPLRGFMESQVALARGNNE